MKLHVIFMLSFMMVYGLVSAQPMPPGVQSPIGSPTEPPSAGRTGAIPYQPNIYGSYGNSVVTGTIGGGKHFRGVVPYGSTFYTDTNLIDQGSEAVSNFLRYSSGNEPFYDPLRTTTTLQRGTGSGLQPPVVAPQGRPGTTAASRQWLESFDVVRLLSPPERRPIETPVDSVQKILERQISPELLEPQQEEPTEKIETEAVVPRELLPTSMQLPELPKLPEPVKPLEPGEMIPEKEVAEREETGQQRNVYDQIRRKLSDRPQEQDILMEEPQQEPKTEVKEEKEEQEVLEELDRIVKGDYRSAEEEQRTILSDYPDYQTMARVKFGEYLAAGEDYLRQGQFYKAADAFELASVWRPEDALVVLARSHALFAAGEYMSSSIYLHRALLKDPRLAKVRVDIASLIGDRDVYDNRLVELSTWQQRSNSGEMAFLGAYILLQDGKIARAQEMIMTAADTLQNAPALEILAEALREASQSKSSETGQQ